MFSRLIYYFLNTNQNLVFFIALFSFSFALFRPYKNNCFNVVDSLFHASLALAMFLSLLSVSYSTSEKAFVLLLFCTPLFYLIILIGCTLYSKCKIVFHSCE